MPICLTITEHREFFILDLNTGIQKVLGDFPGMTFSPRYSPNGKKLIMSLARNGNTDIYEMNLKTQKLERLTNYDGIDTAPSYSLMVILLHLNLIVVEVKKYM